MTLYVDVLFAINFSMDFLSLYLTGVILHKKIYKHKIIISAILGSVYGIIEFIIIINATLGAILSVFVSILMCLIAFKNCSIGRFISSLILFWGVSASLGGIMSIIFGFTNKLFYEFIQEYSYTEVYSGARFFIVASVSILIATLISRIYASGKEVKEVEIEVTYSNEIFKMHGMGDSGNLLKEPISGKSVILISKISKLGKLIEKEQEIKKRYIPYTVVNGEGILKGIVPSKILINGNEVDAILAPIENNKFNGLDAIIPTNLL